MLSWRVQTESPEQTAEWGRALARVLRPGDLICLDAPMGAGKTTLVRAIATELGADPKAIASPTYVIAHEYPIHAGLLVHIDAYRVGAPDELESLGLDALGQAITIVEWPDRLAGRLPDGASIVIDVIGETERAFTPSLPDTWRTRGGLEHLGADVVRCPRTDLAVAPGDPWYPFATERARMADLHGWMSESYRVERPLGPEDDALA